MNGAMNGSRAGRLVVAVAGVLLAGVAQAQGPGGGQGMGPGMGHDMGQGMGPGFAQHRPPMEKAFKGPGGQGQFWNNPRVVETLKLTDAQRKSMDDILLQHKEKLIDLHANLEKAELGMEPLMKADEPNESAILASIDKIAQARAELEKANARFLLALRSKLTPEQWKQVQAFRANGGMRGQQQRGAWGQDGQGHDSHNGMRPGGQGPGMQGPGGQQWHRQGPPPQAPATPSPAPTAPGAGQDQ